MLIIVTNKGCGHCVNFRNGGFPSKEAFGEINVNKWSLPLIRKILTGNAYSSEIPEYQKINKILEINYEGSKNLKDIVEVNEFYALNPINPDDLTDILHYKFYRGENNILLSSFYINGVEYNDNSVSDFIDSISDSIPSLLRNLLYIKNTIDIIDIFNDEFSLNARNYSELQYLLNNIEYTSYYKKTVNDIIKDILITSERNIFAHMKDVMDRFAKKLVSYDTWLDVNVPFELNKFIRKWPTSLLVNMTNWDRSINQWIGNKYDLTRNISEDYTNVGDLKHLFSVTNISVTVIDHKDESFMAGPDRPKFINMLELIQLNLEQEYKKVIDVDLFEEDENADEEYSFDLPLKTPKSALRQPNSPGRGLKVIFNEKEDVFEITPRRK